MVSQAVVSIAADEQATSGHITILIVVAVMALAFVGIVYGLASRTLRFYEVVFCGTFFLLLGGSPFGRWVFDFLMGLGS